MTMQNHLYYTKLEMMLKRMWVQDWSGDERSA
jgi:hypothetical protein